MGLCESSNIKTNKSNRPSKRLSQLGLEENLPIETNNFSINKLENKTKIYQVNTINNTDIEINNCKKSNIIIFDISNKITIINCDECCIFIGPSTSISIVNCKGTSIISISNSIQVFKCSNCYFSLFTTNIPNFSEITDSYLSCFNFSYIELKKLMINKDISPWNNKWSCVNQIKGLNIIKDEQEEQQPENILINDYLKGFKISLNNQEVPWKNTFNPVPMTYGKKIIKSRSKNLLLIINSCEEPETICELCEYGRSMNCYLIMSQTVSKQPECLNKILSIAKKVLKNDLLQAYTDILNNFRNCDYLILLWINSEDNENLLQLRDRFNICFEERIAIDEEEITLIEDLNSIFY
jgi:hypothetical protein